MVWIRNRFRRKKKAKKGRKLNPRQKKEVHKMIGNQLETKQQNVAFPATAVTTTTTIISPIILLNLGTSNFTRIGNRVRIVKMELRLSTDANPALSSRIRIMVIRDKESNGALPPSLTDWLADKTIARATDSPYDIATSPVRYQILHDRVLNLNVGGGATDQPIRNYDHWISRKNHMVYFNAGNAGTYADVQEGNIFVVLYSDAGANGPITAFSFCIWYKDA